MLSHNWRLQSKFSFHKPFEREQSIHSSSQVQYRFYQELITLIDTWTPNCAGQDGKKDQREYVKEDGEKKKEEKENNKGG